MKLELRRPTGPPEDSVAIRLVVAIAVEVAIAAVVTQGAVEPLAAASSLLLAPVGYLASYRQRHRSNLVTKVLLSVGLVVATGQFLQAVRLVGSVDQARIPLASLFLWVQVLHAIDVPRRRDLAFSMVSSLILMAEAGALSLTTSFLLFLVPWAGLAGAWLTLSSRPRPDQVASPLSVRRVSPPGHPRHLTRVRSASMTGVAAVVCGAVVFLAMPRLPGSFVRTPPFSLGGAASSVAGFEGGVSNPGLPAASAGGVIDFASGAYPGFGDVVDLRSRGRLSDDLAFRVRAPQAALWRAEVFDTFDGTLWTIGGDRTVTLPQSDDAASYRVPESVRFRNAAGTETTRVVQTFYIETPQPNVVFAAAAAGEIYFPSGGLRVDRSGSIRAPILLDPGLVYSVVSEVPFADARDLSLARERVPARMAPYLQLPQGLPERVGKLASRIAADRPPLHDRVEAVQAWLRTNTRYNLDVPRDPEGVDPTAHFLFVTREGFCEQIASSMAVMLRTLGIPTRLVTGYGPGDRNPLTGYFEVKQSDAHAWLEVFYPGYGWVPYDPTFGVPHAKPGWGSRLMAGPVFAAIGRFLTNSVPEPLKRAVSAMARAASGAVAPAVALAGALASSDWAAGFTVAAILGSIALAVRTRGRRRTAGLPVAGAEAAFRELAVALAPAGHEREPHETPSEFLGEVAADRALDRQVVAAAELIVRTFERERFAAAKPSEAEVVRARASVALVRDLLEQR